MREKVSDKLRDKVLRRDGYRCRYCGSKGGPFHLDHVYPVAKGGETTAENLVTSCAKCNLQKNSSVGVWPKPLGYFENKHLSVIPFIVMYLFFTLPAGWMKVIQMTGNVPDPGLVTIAGISMGIGFFFCLGMWILAKNLEWLMES